MKERPGPMDFLVRAFIFGLLTYAVVFLAYGWFGKEHSRFPGHALTPTGVMAIRCKQFHLPDL